MKSGVQFFIIRYAALTFTLSLAFTTHLQAQNKPVNNTGQFWGEVDLAGRISKKFKWQFDLQYSRQSAYEEHNLFENNSQLTIRPWLHYTPVKNWRISTFVGLWYNFAVPVVGAREYPEIRAAIQVNYYTPVRKHLMLNRLRPELREMRDQQGVFETVGRLRYEFKYQYLLFHNLYDKNSIYLIAFDEVFANMGSKVTGYKFFDQNRVFLGLGYGITNNIAVETGYFNQFQMHAHDAQADMNHVWQLTLLIDGLNRKVAPANKRL
jgi:hypothetical protein